MLKGSKIILGITGSIAAYKIPLLVRLLIRDGAEVQIVMTPSACDFVTPLTLSTLSKRPVWTKPFDPEDGKWNSHVELGNWADLMLIAPASANTLGKMVNGLADNILLTTYLAAKCPVIFAPAMDLDMYRHPSTQANIQKLTDWGHHLIEPQTGELASGLCGAGRMEEPDAMHKMIVEFLKKKKLMRGKRVLVTAGPTHEPIDPVRFIGNHSSGRMGFALAAEAARSGAEVHLVTGPVELSTPHPAIQRINVKTAHDMAEVCLNLFPDIDITIMAAAVADFTPISSETKKIKKSDNRLVLNLIPTTDILATMGERKSKEQILVGFALETDHEEANALKKLKQKNADLIVMNSLNEPGAAFGTTTNSVTLFSHNNVPLKSGLKQKDEIAGFIVDYIIQNLLNPNESHV